MGKKFATRAIHAGQEPEEITGAVNVPVFLTSTYAQQGIGDHKGWEYSRSHNPTRAALEACVADLEGGVAGFAFASGMAALDTLMRLLDPGDHVVAGDDMFFRSPGAQVNQAAALRTEGAVREAGVPGDGCLAGWTFNIQGHGFFSCSIARYC